MDNVYLRNSLDDSVARVINRIESAHDQVLSLTGTKDGPMIHTRLQSVFNLRYSASLDRMIHEIIMMHAVQAERLGPGGFSQCLDMVRDGIDLLNQGNHLDDVLRRLEANVGERAAAPNSSDVDWLVDTHLKGMNPTHGMMLEALQLAGFNGNIIVERASGMIASVEAIRGYSFKLKPVIPIIAYVENPRIFCIDGYVEEVSEVNGLLEAASQSKEPAIIFVRGMGEDVKHTLSVNYDRGSLKVIPIMVKFDFDGINTLADICAATGAGIVSAAKGDLISAIKFHEAPTIERASIFHDRIVLHEASTHEAVKTQVQKLRKKRAEADQDLVERLFDERLRSLTPNHVSIRLMDDRNYVVNAQAIDHTLRAFKSMLRHGTVKDGDKRLLASTQVAASLHAKRCVETIWTAAAAVIIPELGQ